MTISVSYDFGPLSRIGPQTGLPSAFYVKYEEGDRPTVELEIEVLNGVPVCQAIHVRRMAGPSLSGTELRRVPLTDVIERACRDVALRLVEVLPDGSAAWEPPQGDAVLERAVARDVIKARQRRKITDALLRDVARIYREQLESGQPTQEVAAAYGVSKAQAARYVRQARDRGFLGATTQGKAGD